MPRMLSKSRLTRRLYAVAGMVNFYHNQQKVGFISGKRKLACAS
jgi:hypothetical protein